MSEAGSAAQRGPPPPARGASPGLETVPRLVESFRKGARLCAAATIGVGTLVLVGWLFDVRPFMQVAPGAVAMVPNSAIAFLLAGLSLWLQAGGKAEARRGLSRLAAAAAGLLGLVEIAQYVSRADFGIDQLLFRDPAGLTSVFPGRMAVSTALAFVAISGALLMPERPRARWLADVLALVPGLLGLLSLVGYAFGVRSLIWIGNYKGMALHAAAAFFLLMAGTLFAHPGRPVARLILSDSIGGLMARRLLPFAIAIPLVLSWLERRGRVAELYRDEFGDAILVVSSIVLITVVIVWESGALARIDRERSDATREASRQSETLKSILDNMSEAVLVADTDGKFLVFNPAAERVLGARSEIESSETWVEKVGLFRPDGKTPLPASEVPLRLAIEGKSTDDDEVFIRNPGVPRGVLVSCSARPLRDEGGAIRGGIVVFRDITEAHQAREERKRADETLAARERYFRSLIENAQDVITIIDLDGTIGYMSPAVERILGRPPGAFAGRKVFEFLHPDDTSVVQAAMAHVLTNPDSPRVWLIRMRHANGSWRAMEVIGKRLAGEGAPRIVVNSRDVTESRALEEQLRQAQKMEAVGRLAGGIAHDFNNLLTAILGYAGLAAGRLKADDPSRPDLAEIDRAAHRAADLTKQLLAFSRRQVLNPRVINLNQVVGDTDKMLRRLIGEDIQLVTLLREPLGSVKADTSQIEQALLNLAVNSRDAMPTGGRLTIETTEADLDEGYSLFHFDVPAGRYVVLAVSDTGTGMDATTLSHVFEPFFTTKDVGKGTGLGLSTVYGVVKQSGGHITAYSEPGVGTTFKIYLPRVEDLPERASAATGPARQERGTETILVVEDEDAVRRLVCQSLEAHGYTTLPAAGAREALRLCEKHKGEIHLMLTDVVMPQSGGRELAQTAAALRPSMKVLFMSGYTDDAIVRHGVLEAGAAFLQKPFTPAGLARRVREVLDAPRAATGATPA